MIEHYIEGIGRVEYHTEDKDQADKVFRKHIVDILNAKDKQLLDMENKLKEKDEQYIILWKWAFQEIKKRDEEITEWIAVRDDKNKVINNQTDKIKKLEKQNDEYSDSLIQVLSENESLTTRCTDLKNANEQLMELKTKEIGEALSDGFNNFTVAVRNKLDKETILEYVRTHNDDKLKLLEGMRETLEDINDYLLKKGDITNAGSDKILDYIDCKIEQQKSILA